MLGLLPTPHASAAAPSLPSVHSVSDSELLTKALSGRLTLSPQLSDAVLQLASSQACGGGGDARQSAAPRSGSDGGCPGDDPSGAGDSTSAEHSQDEDQQLEGGGTSNPESPASVAADAKGAHHRLGGGAGGAPASPATPLTPASAEQSDSGAGASGSASASAATTPLQGAGTTAAAAPTDAIALLQAQLAASNERIATLEFHLRARAGEVAAVDNLRRRAHDLEALYTLSASELARAQETAVAQQQAAISQIKAQQLRIMMLEEQLRLAAAGSDELQTALLQHQLAAASSIGGASGPSLSRAGSSVAGAGAPPGTSAFEAATLPLQLSHGLSGLIERQGSLTGPGAPALPDFSSDVWAVRPAGGPGVAVTGGGRAPGARPLTSDGAWGLPAASSVGFAAAAAAAPLALPPLPTASSATAWDAGALLMAGRQAAAAAAAAAGGVSSVLVPHDSADLLADRADAQRLAGLLPFDLDTLGSERSDGGGPVSVAGAALAGAPAATSVGALPPTALLPPVSRAPTGGSSGGARSAALKAAAAQKQAAAAAAHLQMLADKGADPRLRRWSEAWAIDPATVAAAAAAVDATAGPDQNPLAAALKRFAPGAAAGGPAALAAAAAAAARAASLPGDPAAAAAALYGIAAIPCAQRSGRASSAAGEERDAELDAAAQNLRLRSKRDATPNTCVYVGFLGWWVTEKELEACFAPHGKLVSVRLLISKKSRRSREQAFVEFDSIASAQAAIAAMDGIDMPTLVKQPSCGGLVVRFADRKKEDEAGAL